MENITHSDKFFWHRFTDTYLKAFLKLGVTKKVFEFGVYHGDSIDWLSKCFPLAHIVGLDIISQQPSWPQNDNIKYVQCDQNNRRDIHNALFEFGSDIDLIIEDGSHLPHHQASCLAEGMAHLRNGGLYILEDISSSLPDNKDFASFNFINGKRLPNALNAILAIQHHIETGISFDTEQTLSLAHPLFLNSKDIQELLSCISHIEIVKRTLLPLKCYACGSTHYDYVNWTCQCGINIHDPCDSMTALIWKK